MSVISPTETAGRRGPGYGDHDPLVTVNDRSTILLKGTTSCDNPFLS